MKFSFLTLDFRRFDLEFAFKCAQRYGFEGIEIWGGRPHAYAYDMTPERCAQINSWKKQYGLEIPMFCPDGLNQHKRLTVTDANERRDALDYVKRGIDAASALEAPRILVVADHPGYNLDYSDCWDVFCENIQELADYAKPKGVRITVEPLTAMESPIITRTDDCVRLLRAVQNDNVHFMMDVAPPIIAYEPFSDYFSKLGSKMDYIHLCNNDGVTDAHVRLENGVIPMLDMFTVFKNWGYEGFVSAELYTEVYHDPELLLANTARVIREIRDTLSI